MTTCAECGREFERRPGPGRPAKYCDTCRAGNAKQRAWKRRNAFRLAREDAARRAEAGEEVRELTRKSHDEARKRAEAWRRRKRAPRVELVTL